MKSNVFTTNVVRKAITVLVVTDLTPDELNTILKCLGRFGNFETWWSDEKERDEKSVGYVSEFQGLSIEPILDYGYILSGLYRVTFSVSELLYQEDQDNYIRDLRRFLTEKTGMNI